MSTRVRSFSKINLGLAIGPPRADGFHALTTLYQTLELHDVVTVTAKSAAQTKITLTTNHPEVPTDNTNTAWKMVELALDHMKVAVEVTIHIQKNLPVQGGLGAGSANAVAALLGMERELNQQLVSHERLELAAEIGSDVPLFLLGGTVLGLNRGEEVYPLPDLPAMHCVIAAPPIGVSTPQAFRDWDALHTLPKGPVFGLSLHAAEPKHTPKEAGLTVHSASDRLKVLSRALASVYAGPDTSGVFGHASIEHEDLAENALLALVRTGIENDFEEVVFPLYPSLREIKRSLMGSESGSPALYAALSGSGSALFGLYRTKEDAVAAQQRVQSSGFEAQLTKTLPRAEYWRTMFAE
jgi:4-diphosphocytidyl-2-C-methyl-D-erythritol kinase